MSLHKTKNDLKSNVKTTVISLLNARLAEGIDLALLTKQAHWNVKGPQFIAVHEMIDGFRGEIDGHVDTIAERIVQLGGTALGTELGGCQGNIARGLSGRHLSDEGPPLRLDRALR